jgi:hypothetical protein
MVNGRHIRVVGSERLLRNRQCPPIQALRLRKLASILVEHGQVIEAGGNFEILRPERCLCECQGLLIERLCLGVAPLHPVDPCEHAERLHPDHLHLGAGRHLLHHRHRPVGQALRFGVFAQLFVHACQGVQDVGHIRMVRPDSVFHDSERLPAEREGFLELPRGLSRDGQIVEADGFV